jgi:hypothetical protein
MATEDNIKRFMEAQSRAKKIIQMDVNGGLKKYEGQAKQLAESSFNDDAVQSTPNIAYNEPTISKTNSKLPKEILESFKNKQIDTTPLGFGTNTSILDEINYKTQGQLFNQQKPKQQTVTEQKNIQTQTSNVDYSMIKMIVEDCMKKYTSSLKKSIINESKNNDDILKAMKIGDKFSFITNNGDLYEAELKFIKNINKKKVE